MAIGEQDHGGVPVPVPVITGRLHQPLDLLVGEILADAVMGIGKPGMRAGFVNTCCCRFVQQVCNSGWGATGRRRRCFLSRGTRWQAPVLRQDRLE
jgi:hypothetical protein